MYLIYFDDSKDEKSCVFSALAIPVENWKDSFQKIKEFRRLLNKSYGIYVRKEIHAWKFVSGRGKISPNIVSKFHRSINISGVPINNC